MQRSPILSVKSPSMPLVAAMALVGCSGQAFDDGSSSNLGVAASAVTITNCTGAAISAAVAAGGDVVLDCGSTHFVSVPQTDVTHPTRLRPAVAGSLTLTQTGFMFNVKNGASFEVDNLAFLGSGAALHVLSGSALVVGSTFSSYRTSGFALTVQNQSTLTVSGSTFSNNGNSNNSFASPIYSEGSTLVVRDSTFSNNVSGGSGGAITVVGGGNVTISNSTFAGNVAGLGGAIYMSGVGGTKTITNSTFFSNHGNSNGGAVFNGGTSMATLQNCTFADSGSPNGTLTGNLQVQNSILLDSVSPSTACQFAGFGNIEWPTSLQLCGSGFRYGNPVLGSLASNGGPTQTMALGTGSAAIDTEVGAPPATDQRGVARPRDGDFNGSFIGDVGAYER